MANNKVYKDSYGSQLRFNSGEDLSTASAVKIKYKKPDGVTTGEWTTGVAVITSNYVDQETGLTVPANYGVGYTTLNGDIDAAGEWKFQIHVTFSGGFYGPGNTYTLTVYDDFE